jgi:hypothetical protein
MSNQWTEVIEQKIAPLEAEIDRLQGRLQQAQDSFEFYERIAYEQRKI